jgi:hypothetical protein
MSVRDSLTPHARCRTVWPWPEGRGTILRVLATAAAVGSAACAHVPLQPDHDLRCNGQRAICDRRVPDVVFAGTHNSMSAASLGWAFPNHERGIQAQLDAGYRALLIDTHYWHDRQAIQLHRLRFPESYQDLLDGVLDRVDRPRAGPFLCHGICALGATPLADGLATIAEFLRRHPHEVVILSIEDYITPHDTYEAFRDSGLLPLVYTPDGGPWPTLRELIERNERVIVLADHNGGRPNWYLPFRLYMQDTPFHARHPSEFSCVPNRGRADAPMLLINHWIATIPPNPLDAARVNRYEVIMERVERCRRQRGMEPTIIAVDFHSIGDVPRVVHHLNLRRAH